ncbi:DUF58 domain-containing protein [Actinomyces minihominis]|uniref:DUF58 domain-containing protein n=1 Tax=Actinomyces minihominis TaxID=2002838 RepID=UPI000C081EBB|nr:DUF58 domain-containing protein [Actinomyces minihominis]
MSSPRLHDYSRLVSYPVQKKLLSLLDGYHRGEGAGSSHEFLDMAEYKPGDDISAMDWKGTARLSQPVIKRFESTAVLSIIIASDTGAAMAAAGEDGEPKSATAEELVRALAWLVSSHGDLLGLVSGNARSVRTMPARAGVAHSETLIRVASASETSGGPSDLLAVLRHVEVGRRRSVIFVITDESQINAHTAAVLRRLSARHEVGVFLIGDYDPTGIGESADIQDVEAGAIPAFVEGDQILESQWRMYRRFRSREVDALLDAIPLRYVRLGGRDGVLDALISVMGGGGRGSSAP